MIRILICLSVLFLSPACLAQNTSLDDYKSKVQNLGKQNLDQLNQQVKQDFSTAPAVTPPARPTTQAPATPPASAPAPTVTTTPAIVTPPATPSVVTTPVTTPAAPPVTTTIQPEATAPASQPVPAYTGFSNPDIKEKPRSSGSQSQSPNNQSKGWNIRY